MLAFITLTRTVSRRDTEELWGPYITAKVERLPQGITSGTRHNVHLQASLIVVDTFDIKHVPRQLEV
jgi:hypothetical protein